MSLISSMGSFVCWIQGDSSKEIRWFFLANRRCFKIHVSTAAPGASFWSINRSCIVKLIKLTVRLWTRAFPRGKLSSNHQFSGAMLVSGRAPLMFPTIIKQGQRWAMAMTMLSFHIACGIWPVSFALIKISSQFWGKFVAPIPLIHLKNHPNTENARIWHPQN